MLTFNTVGAIITLISCLTATATHRGLKIAASSTRTELCIISITTDTQNYVQSSCAFQIFDCFLRNARLIEIHWVI